MRAETRLAPRRSALTAVGLALAVAGATLLTESTAGRPRPVDVAGMVLLAAGLTVLLAGLTEARRLPGGERLC